MKKRPFILITGDDSVRAEGSILVKRVVEGFADFKIVATKEQQSAVGAMMNLRDGGEWGTESVDGAETIWVDGTPVDAAYFAFDYFERKPDLVISGMNLGPNFSNGSMLISGTVAASVIAAHSRNTPSIAFSIFAKPERWLAAHNGEFNEDFLKYPGQQMRRILDKFFEAKMPKDTFWNVNFPEKETDKIKIVRVSDEAHFPNRMKIGKNKYGYIPAFGDHKVAKDTDVRELYEGFITLSPCKLEFTNFDELRAIEKLFS